MEQPEENRQAPNDLERIKAMLRQLPAAERKAFIAREAAELLTPQELAELKARGHYRSNVRLLHNLSRGDQSDNGAEAGYRDRSLAKATPPPRDTARLPELAPEPIAPLPNLTSRLGPSPSLADPTPPKVRLPRPVKHTNPWLDRSLLAVEWVCALVIIFILGQWLMTQWNSDDSGSSAVAQTEQSNGLPAQAAAVDTALPMIAATATPTAIPAHPVAPAAPSSSKTQANQPPTATATQALPTNTPLAAQALPTDTPIVTLPITDAIPVRVVIPSIKVDSVVKEVHLDVNSWQVANYAVGYHEYSSLPGQQGNVVMAGHRDIYGSVFRYLNVLKPKDVVLVYTKTKVYRYIVVSSRIVKPTEVSVMQQTSDYRLTLITCTPIGIASHRIIVVAELDRTDVPIIGGNQ